MESKSRWTYRDQKGFKVHLWTFLAVLSALVLFVLLNLSVGMRHGGKTHFGFPFGDAFWLTPFTISFMPAFILNLMAGLLFAVTIGFAVELSFFKTQKDAGLASLAYLVIAGTGLVVSLTIWVQDPENIGCGVALVVFTMFGMAGVVADKSRQNK